MMSMNSWMYTHSFTQSPPGCRVGGSAGKRAGAVRAPDPAELLDQRRCERDAVLEPFGAAAVLHLARHEDALHALGRLGLVDVAHQAVDVGAEVGDGQEVIDVERDEEIAARHTVEAAQLTGLAVDEPERRAREHTG